jgi:hypothetical protein
LPGILSGGQSTSCQVGLASCRPARWLIVRALDL